jgi:hypothetical protein
MWGVSGMTIKVVWLALLCLHECLKSSLCSHWYMRWSPCKYNAILGTHWYTQRYIYFRPLCYGFWCRILPNCIKIVKLMFFSVLSSFSSFLAQKVFNKLKKYMEVFRQGHDNRSKGPQPEPNKWPAQHVSSVAPRWQWAPPLTLTTPCVCITLGRDYFCKDRNCALRVKKHQFGTRLFCVLLF